MGAVDATLGTCDQKYSRALLANNGAVMPSESKVTLPDVYNVVRLLLRLGSTFDEIAALGFYAGKRRLTGPALKVWYEAEREQRAPITAVVEKSNKRERGSKV
jgi:hypothetical protein